MSTHNDDHRHRRPQPNTESPRPVSRTEQIHAAIFSDYEGRNTRLYD
ncbi:hypothetical protein GS538_09235 [Rhodococcus hoagii]|nr:hypothetical protein [Prescottella equi]